MKPEIPIACILVMLAVVDGVLLKRLSRPIRRVCWIDTLSRLVEEHIVTKHLIPHLRHFTEKLA